MEGEENRAYSLVLVILSPIFLRCSVGTFVRNSEICSCSSSVLETVSFLGVVRQTLSCYWDFTDGDVVLLARWEIADLVLEKRQEGVRIASGCQLTILAVRSTEFQDGRHSCVW